MAKQRIIKAPKIAQKKLFAAVSAEEKSANACEEAKVLVQKEREKSKNAETMVEPPKRHAEKSFLTGALVLTVGGLVAKVLGAVYRIPLTNLLGSYAMGLYQLVFPLYTLLLSLSMGFAVAVSRSVARQAALNKCADCKKILRCAIVVMSTLGAILSLALFVFAKPIALLQGNANAVGAYRAISPAILLVSVSSAIKGYFQGQMEMKPTALSQIAEQIIKLCLGLLLANLYMPDEIKAVNAAVVAVTVSEVVALLVFGFSYFAYQNKFKTPSANFSVLKSKQIYAELFKIALPVTLGGVLFPLSQLIDSSLILNLIKEDATRLYGIWSGPVHSLFAMPVILAGGVAAAILPSISGSAAKRNIDEINKKINLAFKLNNVIVLPCVTGFLLMAQPIVNILYGALPSADLLLAAKLLSVSAVGSLLLSCAGMLTSVLQGVGKEYVSLLFLSLGIGAKTILNIFLLPNPDINVFAVAFSTILCYFVNAGLSAVYLKKKLSVKIDAFVVFTKPLACCLVMAVPLTLATLTAPGFVNSTFGALALIALSGILYAASVYFFKIFEGLTVHNMKKYLNRGKRNGKKVWSSR